MNEWAKKMLVQHLEEIFFVGFLLLLSPPEALFDFGCKKKKKRAYQLLCCWS